MEITKSLKKGAFLTTKHNEKVNTMTISWGNIGAEWGKDVFITLVRDSRFTKEALDKTGIFTVTIPKTDEMKEALSFCGTKSGRDYDKIKECALKLKDGRAVDVPVIDCKSIAVECRVIYAQRMDETAMTPEFKEKFYASGDIHTLYHGEILAMYEV